MNKFNRLFHGNHVARVGPVDVVKQGRERGRFTGTRRTSHKNESAPHIAKALDYIGNSEFLNRGNFSRDETEDGSKSILLFEVVATKTGLFIHRVSEVEVTFFEEQFEGFWIADFSKHLLERLVIEDAV